MNTKYFFILHSKENGTWMITPSFPTGDYILPFVEKLKRKGFYIYNCGVYSNETDRLLAEEDLQDAKKFYDRTFHITVKGKLIDVTPSDILQYYSGRYYVKSEQRYAKMVAVHKFAEQDCTKTIDGKTAEYILKCGDFQRKRNISFKMSFSGSLWNVYIIRKGGKYKIKAYCSGRLEIRTGYTQTKEEALYYCLNGFNRK